MATLPIVKVQRLYRQISDLLIQKFKENEFPPGSALPPERELAQQLGVGRSSVREALIALEIAGWVDIKTGHGVFVCHKTPEAGGTEALGSAGVEELLQARELIEGETARLAAANANPDQLSRLVRLMDALDESTKQNTGSFMELDEQFHHLIAEMADNFVFIEFIDTLWNKRYDELFTQFNSHYGSRDLSQAMNLDHRAICNAILARDPQAAKAAMQAHIRHVHASFFADNPGKPADQA